MRLVTSALIAFGLLWGSAALANVNPSHTATSQATDSSIDLVVIKKSERVLYLYDQGLIVGQYPIALGLSPVGTKHRQGDDKTPIGAYKLDWRNPDSKFHRSLHISYPNDSDRAYARAHGVPAGDLIMIHGQPSYDARPRTGDWTNGCIAVSNAAIDDIWARVPDGTPIQIYP